MARTDRGIAWVFSGLLLIAASALGGVADHVSTVQMSKEFHYGYPGDPLGFQFDMAVETQRLVAMAITSSPSNTPRVQRTLLLCRMRRMAEARYLR